METSNATADSKKDSGTHSHPRLAEQELFGLNIQLETRERLVRLEEENRHLKELVTELSDKQKRLRQNLDELRSEQSSQLNERAGKLSTRIDTLGRRSDRLFSFWMLSTMLLMLFVVGLMAKLSL